MDAFKGMPGGDKVEILSERNFTKILKNEKGVLVMFHAPWCNYCKLLKPTFGEVANMLATQKIPGKVAAIDCSINTQMIQKFSIQGYPTMKYFESGTYVKDYKGDRSASDIFKFIKSNLRPVKN